MSMSVEVEIYEFLKKNETGFYRNPQTKEVTGYVCVNFGDLQEFAELVGASQFDDGGMEVTMMNGYVAIDVNGIIEGYGHGLQNYKNCFSKEDWETWGKEIIAQESKYQ